MASIEKELYRHLLDNLSEAKLTKGELAKPDPTLEEEVTKIYTQARTHRNRLVLFYIWYTIIFSVLVASLIFWQGYVRVAWGNSHFEIIPQWALNLLVVGMFGQFVGLLTIVTQRVWDFQPFFNHHNHLKGNNDDPPAPKRSS